MEVIEILYNCFFQLDKQCWIKQEQKRKEHPQSTKNSI